MACFESRAVTASNLFGWTNTQDILTEEEVTKRLLLFFAYKQIALHLTSTIMKKTLIPSECETTDIL